MPRVRSSTNPGGAKPARPGQCHENAAGQESASPQGASFTSPGQRPGNPANQNPPSPEGAEQPELPVGWSSERLGNLVRTEKGRKPAILLEAPTAGAQPYLTADFLRTGNAARFVPTKSLGACVFCSRESPILIWDGSNAGDAFLGVAGVLASTMVRLDPNANRLNSDFLYFFLKTQFDFLNRRTTGSTIPHINKTVFENLPVLLPPLPEQRAIAGVLRTVQRAREACERVLAATRQLKQSLLHHLFTYGPVPFPQAAHVRLKETEIGQLPEHWETAKLGDHATIGNGSTPKRTEPRYWRGGTIPWLTSGKVHERIIRDADEFVTDAARAECHLPMVPKGSLVVAITGQGKTLGNAAQLALDACVSQHLAYVTFKDTWLVPEFVLAFLRLHYRQLQAASRGGGSTKGALTCGFLKSFVVPLPPLSEQREIARQLGAVDAKIAALEKRRAALDALFRSLLEHLMTGRLRLPEFANAKPPGRQAAGKAGA